MMVQRFCFFIAVFTLASVHVDAQERFQPSKIVPPSPTASALGAYGDVPISPFSGQPNIHIPLHTIKTAQHQVNISLSYNSNVRVNQEAGWVGLGWSLNSGGVITRTIRGQDDFSSVSYPEFCTGYYKAGALPQPEPSHMPPQMGEDLYRAVTSNDPAMEYIEDVMEGRIDTEPDIFYYNFCGYSGSFVLGKEVDGSVVFQREQSDLKFEINFNVPNQDYGQWKITTPEGYIYAFATEELSESVNTGDYALRESEMLGLGPYTGHVLGDQIGGDKAFKRTLDLQATSWYLDYIEAPNGDKVSFAYTTFGKYLSNINVTQQAYDLIGSQTVANPGRETADGEVICEDQTIGFPSSKIYNWASRQIIDEVVLSSITYAGGRVDFETGPRKDVETFNGGSGGRKLEEIIVYNGATPVKSFLLGYDYFNKSSQDNAAGNVRYARCRLKLESVWEPAKPRWYFEYYDPEYMPSKYSKQIDWWGYPSSSGVASGGGLNPTTMTEIGSLLPRVVYNNVTYQGSMREPDPTGNLTKQGVLKKIWYPTGGFTEFFFEPNRLPVVPAASETVCQTISAVRNMGNLSQVEDVYTSQFSANGSIKLSFWAYPTYALTPVSSSQGIAWLKNSSGVILETFYLTNPESTVAERTVNLSQGQYTLEVAVLADHSIDLGAGTCTIQQVNSRIGAGIRIQRITDHDFNGKKLREKKYLYTVDGLAGGISSGADFDESKHSEIRDLEKFYWATCNVGLTGPHWKPEASGSFLIRSSSSLYPLGFNSQTGLVGYTIVHELIGENGEGGKTVYAYRSEPTGFNKRQLKMGDLKYVERYNADGDPVFREEYSYVTKKLDCLLGLTIKGHWLFDPCPTCFLIDYPGLTEVPYNANWSEWVVVDSKTTTEFTSTGDLINVERYYHNSTAHKMVTSSTVMQSDGTLRETILKRPPDFTLSPYSDMVTKHIISPIIETEEWKNGAFLSREKSNYQSWGNNIFRPATVEFKKGSANSEIRLRYLEYDEKGNIVSLSRELDKRHSYLWDYDKTFAVAEIIGASPSQVAYTSFETSYKGNWNYTGSPVNTIPAKTGSFAYNLQNASISRVLAAGKYKLECFAKALPTLAGVNVISTQMPVSTDVNGWGLYNWEIEAAANANLVLSTSSSVLYIDALRIYPVEAQMSCYTYHPVFGQTSNLDTNGKTTTYEYDNAGRLIYVKDDEFNIQKAYKYNYK
jgi:hypothetical protein